MLKIEPFSEFVDRNFNVGSLRFYETSALLRDGHEEEYVEYVLSEIENSLEAPTNQSVRSLLFDFKVHQTPSTSPLYRIAKWMTVIETPFSLFQCGVDIPVSLATHLFIIDETLE